jgi:hypothetical protein
MLTGLIALKNSKRRSDQLAAETGRAIAKAETDTALYNLVTRAIAGQISPEELEILMRVPVIRKAMILALKSGGRVNSVDIRPIQAD